MPESTAPSTREITPLVYSIEEALRAVPIGRTTMSRLIASGELRTICIGRRRFVPREALADLAAKGTA